MRQMIHVKPRFFVIVALTAVLSMGFITVAQSEEAQAADTINIVFHGDRKKAVNVPVNGKLKSSQFPKNPKSAKFKDSNWAKAFKVKFVGWTAGHSKCFTTKKAQKKAKTVKRIGQTTSPSGGGTSGARIGKIFEPHDLVKQSTVFQKYFGYSGGDGITTNSNREITKVDLYPVYVIHDKVAGVRFTMGGIFTDIVLPYKSTLAKYDSFCKKQMRHTMWWAGGYSKSYAKKAKLKGYYKKMKWDFNSNKVYFSKSFSTKKKITAEHTELYAHWLDSSGNVVV